MITVKVYLKNGELMEFDCEEMNIKINGFNEIVSYEIKHGESKRRLMQMSIPNITGIVVEDY